MVRSSAGPRQRMRSSAARSRLDQPDVEASSARPRNALINANARTAQRVVERERDPFHATIDHSFSASTGRTARPMMSQADDVTQLWDPLFLPDHRQGERRHPGERHGGLPRFGAHAADGILERGRVT